MPLRERHLFCIANACKHFTFVINIRLARALSLISSSYKPLLVPICKDMKTFIITLSLLTFSLTSNSQNKTAPFGKYYHLNGYGLQVPFEVLPIKTDPIENAAMTSQEFRSFPTTTINSAYAISILNSKQFCNPSDSLKELEFFCKTHQANR